MSRSLKLNPGFQCLPQIFVICLFLVFGRPTLTLVIVFSVFFGREQDQLFPLTSLVVLLIPLSSLTGCYVYQQDQFSILYRQWHIELQIIWLRRKSGTRVVNLHDVLQLATLALTQWYYNWHYWLPPPIDITNIISVTSSHTSHTEDLRLKFWMIYVWSFVWC